MAQIFKGDGHDFVDRLVDACLLPKQLQDGPIKERELVPYFQDAQSASGLPGAPVVKSRSPYKQQPTAAAATGVKRSHAVRSPPNGPVGPSKHFARSSSASHMCPAFLNPPHPASVPFPSSALIFRATLVKA